ncbi:MAG: lactonase family protein, partial [Myxococcota bacterium]|nr:lactonase family protein [Myxococcota bacterium]
LGPGATADAIVVPHRSGRASLFLDDPALPRPVLTDVIGGISNDIVSAVVDPTTGLVWVTSGASVAARATNELLALGPIVSAANPNVARLAVVRRIALTGISDGLDTRDMTFDPTGDRAWVLSRRPESVITLDFSLAAPSAGLAPIGEIFAVAAGPSRIVRVVIGGRTFLVVTAYDANNVSVVDPDLGLVATVAGLTGPFEMAFDPSRNWLFVTNFRSSTIGVVDLAPLATSESPRLIAVLAPPTPPSPF